MLRILIAASVLSLLAMPDNVSANVIENRYWEYGPTEAEACRKTLEKAKSNQLDRTKELVSIAPCSCNPYQWVKDDGSNRFACETTIRTRKAPTAASRPGTDSSPR